jgi:hypothetical protein
MAKKKVNLFQSAIDTSMPESVWNRAADVSTLTHGLDRIIGALDDMGSVEIEARHPFAASLRNMQNDLDKMLKLLEVAADSEFDTL